MLANQSSSKREESPICTMPPILRGTCNPTLFWQAVVRKARCRNHRAKNPSPAPASAARRRSSCACAVIKGLIFAVGGYASRFGTLRSVLRLDRAGGGRWVQEEGLLERREGHACVGSDVDEGVVYAVGGGNATGALSSTERARLYSDGRGEVRLKRWEVGTGFRPRRRRLGFTGGIRGFVTCGEALLDTILRALG